jgi:hypothetical protein
MRTDVINHLEKSWSLRKMSVRDQETLLDELNRKSSIIIIYLIISLNSEKFIKII